MNEARRLWFVFISVFRHWWIGLQERRPVPFVPDGSLPKMWRMEAQWELWPDALPATQPTASKH